MANTPNNEEILTRGGEMGELIRTYDWASGKLGSIENWPQSLKIAVQIMLDSRYPMYIAWGKDLTFLYNDAYFKMTLGPKHPWALGKIFREVWSEVWPEVSPRIESVMQTGQPTWDEGLLLFLERRGFPEETYHTFSWSPVPDDKGNIGGLLCVVTEDTEKAISERQLTLLRELAARTADTRDTLEACERCAKTLATNPWDIPFAMIYLDDPDSQKMTLVAASGIDFEHPVAPKHLLMNNEIWPFAKVLEANKPYLISDLDSANYPDLPMGVWQRSPNQAAIIPISSGKARDIGFLVIGLNPFRLFDDKYQRFLELTAGQIASSISNAKAYEEERKRAEALSELNHAKTTFFSNVSHEFRTPLTLMLGPIEDALNDSNTIPDNRIRMEVAHRNALRLLKLVNTLLDFSRIEAGRVQATYIATNLDTYTCDLASNFRSAIEKAGLKYKVNCSPLSEPAYINHEMWEKIVLNLLSNAFKYTLQGKIELTFKEDDGQAVLSIRDTGIGIPKEELPHIFERFHRVEGAQGRTHEGSGIGLAMVQELVKLHGGQVEAESEYGKGSVFTVRIPLGSDHLPAERIENISEHSFTTARAEAFAEEAMRWLPDTPKDSPILQFPELVDPLTANARIVLADDNADMRDYIQRLLGANYRVEAVPDGEAALAAINREIPDLVLTDIMMPNLDGFGLLAYLRGDERTSRIPIIMLSARAGEEARIEGVEAGADDYLLKPFSARELIARVNSAIRLSRIRREAEQRFYKTANAAPAILWITTSKGYCTFISQSWFDLTGQSTEEALGFGWLNMVHPEDIDRVKETFLNANSKREPFELDYRLLLESGEYCWAVDAGRPHFSENGEFLGYIGSVLDITQRKSMEDILRKSEALQAGQKEALKSALDGAPLETSLGILTNTAIKQIGPDMRAAFYLANPDGTTLHHIVGMCHGYAMAVDGFKVGQDSLACGLAAYNKQPIITKDVKQEPLWQPWLWMAEKFDFRGCWSFPVYKIGKFVGTFAIYYREPREATQQDIEFISLLTQTASIIIAQNQEMEERRHAEKALIEEKNRAEEANRAKSEFLANMSHEIRTPMNAVIGLAHILGMNRLLPAREKEFIHTLRTSAEHLMTLINDMLDVSKIESKAVELERILFNPVELIEDCVSIASVTAKAKNIELIVEQLCPSAQLTGDPLRIRQILTNLLSNAIKFTEEGSISVNANYTQAGEHNVWFTISVRDTGIGMTPEVCAKIFGKFTQADSSITRKYGGTGLGLTISKQLAEIMGGDITVSSKLGIGTEFILTLPLDKYSQTSREQNSEETLEFSSSASRANILLVEDHAPNILVATTLLSDMGHSYHVVRSGREAIDALEQNSFDLVLMDVQMQELDGLETTRIIRKREATRKIRPIPIIAMTAHALSGDREKCLAAGMNGYIPKPFEAEMLANVIDKTLANLREAA